VEDVGVSISKRGDFVFC